MLHSARCAQNNHPSVHGALVSWHAGSHAPLQPLGSLAGNPLSARVCAEGLMHCIFCPSGLRYQASCGDANAGALTDRPSMYMHPSASDILTHRSRGGDGGWLESLHRQHVDARARRRKDVKQCTVLKKELVAFFGLYNREQLGRADDLLQQWRTGRELEDINRELKQEFHHSLFDLHEIDAGRDALRDNSLQTMIMAERLKRSEADAIAQREGRLEAEARSVQMEEQNNLLRADLAVAVEEGIKYRESLRDWAALEERRSVQSSSGKKTPGEAAEDARVLRREVDMLRDARQRDLSAAKEQHSREIALRDAEKKKMEEEYQKVVAGQTEAEGKNAKVLQQARHEIAHLKLETSRHEQALHAMKSAMIDTADHEKQREAQIQELAGTLAASENKCVALEEALCQLRNESRDEKKTAKSMFDAETSRLKEENDTLRQENAILLKAHHESKHTNELLKKSNLEGREEVITLQRTVLQLEETIRRSEELFANTMSSDEAECLTMQVNVLKNENHELVTKVDDLRRERDELRAQRAHFETALKHEREMRDYSRNRESIDSWTEDTSSDMTSIDSTILLAVPAAIGKQKSTFPQTVMSSRSVGSLAKQPQQLANALSNMTSTERFAAIAHGSFTTNDLSAALACCNVQDAFAIFRDFPGESNAAVLVAMPENSRRGLMSLFTSEMLASLLASCADSERSLLLQVIETDNLASVLALLSAIDQKLVISQLPSHLQKAALLADKLRKSDASDRAQALVALQEPLEAALVVAFLATNEIAPALDVLHYKEIKQILATASDKKQVDIVVDMQMQARCTAFDALTPQGKAGVLLAVLPTEATQLFLGMGTDTARAPVTAALPLHVQEAIEMAESLMKVPPEERWSALENLNTSDQTAAMSWMQPKDVVRMARQMPTAESKRLFQILTPDVCAAALMQMQAEERAQQLLSLSATALSTILKLLPRPCLVGSLAILKSESAVMSAISKEHIEVARTATGLTRQAAKERAETLSNLQGEKVATTLLWLEAKTTCAALVEMALGARKATLDCMAPETRAGTLKLMTPQIRAKALNSMSPVHRSHALRTLSSHSIASAMRAMSTAERNLVTASLPAAARRALLRARELDNFELEDVHTKMTELSAEDRCRALAWMGSASVAAGVLVKYTLNQQADMLQSMSVEDGAVLISGMQPADAGNVLAKLSLRLRIQILTEMTLSSAGSALNSMAVTDRKLSLSAMSLDMEDAVYSWQQGSLTGDRILGDLSSSSTMERVQSTPETPRGGVSDETLIEGRRRHRAKKEVRNLLDSSLLAAAFPNVSRVMKSTSVSTSAGDSDSD